jgi:hypothetical protein
MMIVHLSFAGSNGSLEKLRIGNQIQGWREEKGSYQTFDADGLFKLIDGGAPTYIDKGMRKGFFERLLGPDSATMEIYMEDFGMKKNAKNMALSQKTEYSDASCEAGADSSKILMREILGGWWVCGSINKFYFEFTITGKNSLQEKTEARKFIDYYGKTAAMPN